MSYLLRLRPFLESQMLPQEYVVTGSARITDLTIWGLFKRGWEECDWHMRAVLAHLLADRAAVTRERDRIVGTIGIWFQEGVSAAREQGEKEGFSACPYDLSSLANTWWCRGYTDEMRLIRAEKQEEQIEILVAERDALARKVLYLEEGD